jgi:hypothetical protein
MICALCLAIKGEQTPADPGWPYAPMCRSHIVQCGGTVEKNIVVVDFSAARDGRQKRGGKYG